jgi:hypothetical protein
VKTEVLTIIAVSNSCAEIHQFIRSYL